MHVQKIRQKVLVEFDDNEVTNLYCALIVYTSQLSNPILKANSQKLLDEPQILMREMGF